MLSGSLKRKWSEEEGRLKPQFGEEERERERKKRMAAGKKAAVVLALLVVVAGVAAAQQCRCSAQPGRECTFVQLVSTSPDTCVERTIPCGDCFCDDEGGDLVCDFVTATAYEFLPGAAPQLCAQTREIRIATCPPPAPTPTPTAPLSRVFRCSTDKRVPWIPPLVCTIVASDFPPGAVIEGASMTILETANGTATFRNQKATPANGTYRAFIFQTVTTSPAGGLFSDWPDVDTGDNEVNIDPFTDYVEIISLGPVPFPVPASANFSALAQPLISGGTNIDLTFSTNSLLTTSFDFTGAALNSAFAKVDVTISVFYS
mmetsp:Transcript_9458/g.25169  ORF Transcript_9458/g.25169 Transcript_9458/m.25169 type:complete len:317 (-) Transcript_9458:932-1882(-)